MIIQVAHQGLTMSFAFKSHEPRLVVQDFLLLFGLCQCWFGVIQITGCGTRIVITVITSCIGTRWTTWTWTRLWRKGFIGVWLIGIRILRLFIWLILRSSLFRKVGVGWFDGCPILRYGHQGFFAWPIIPFWRSLNEKDAIRNSYFKVNFRLTFMASTSMVEATNSPRVEGPASLVIHDEAERSRGGSSWNKNKVFIQVSRILTCCLTLFQMSCQHVKKPKQTFQKYAKWLQNPSKCIKMHQNSLISIQKDSRIKFNESLSPKIVFVFKSWLFDFKPKQRPKMTLKPN